MENPTEEHNLKDFPQTENVKNEKKFKTEQ